MMQIVEMSDDEKRIMYRKCSKESLISMLIQANKHLMERPPIISAQYLPKESIIGKKETYGEALQRIDKENSFQQPSGGKEK